MALTCSLDRHTTEYEIVFGEGPLRNVQARHGRLGMDFASSKVRLVSFRLEPNGMDQSKTAQDTALRRSILTVALANLAYFFFEFAVAKRIGSVSLFADSIDFLEDTAINLLILTALRWSLRKRARVGMLLSGVIIIPGVALLWTAWQKLIAPIPPEPWPLSGTALGALVVNVGCALLLTRFRHHSGSLTKAAFLSARNDTLANLAIIAAGLITLRWPSAWPDLIVGLGIAAMNADAAMTVLKAARAEHRSAAV
jgi:Co/Zn/Cd efflux system component